MALKTATASLSSSFIIFCPTGFIPYQDGIIDSTTGYIKPNGSASWGLLSGKSWSNYTNYQLSFNPIKWTAPIIDIGEIRYFNLGIEADFDGTLYYIIHVSSTGLFQGEETEYLIQDGNYNIDAFYGRYVYVTAFVNGSIFRSMNITTSNKKSTYHLQDVDTSTLSGTAAERTLSLSLSISSIIDMQIQPKAASTYAVNLYVSDTATSKVLIPVIISKSASSPKFALFGIDNDARNGVVDITLTALPRQVMTGGNLVVIT
jgi:hypothetical protein